MEGKYQEIALHKQEVKDLRQESKENNQEMREYRKQIEDLRKEIKEHGSDMEAQTQEFDAVRHKEAIHIEVWSICYIHLVNWTVLKLISTPYFKDLAISQLEIASWKSQADSVTRRMNTLVKEVEEKRLLDLKENMKFEQDRSALKKELDVEREENER